MYRKHQLSKHQSKINEDNWKIISYIRFHNKDKFTDALHPLFYNIKCLKRNWLIDSFLCLIILCSALSFHILFFFFFRSPLCVQILRFHARYILSHILTYGHHARVHAHTLTHAEYSHESKLCFINYSS